MCEKVINNKNSVLNRRKFEKFEKGLPSKFDGDPCALGDFAVLPSRTRNGPFVLLVDCSIQFTTTVTINGRDVFKHFQEFTNFWIVCVLYYHYRNY